jgi:hypothetical protein
MVNGPKSFIKHTFFFPDRKGQLTAISCGSRMGREGMLEHGQMEETHQSLRKVKRK